MNNKKIFWGLMFGAIIIALLIVALIFMPNKKQATPVIKVASDIEINIKPGDTITSPLTITGLVRGNGWNGFEGQVGTVTLLDDKGKELAKTYLPATSDWMVLPTNFKTSLTFSAVSGTSGSLVFHNENASGDPVRDKVVTVPVVFK